jgi:hypothetical protein
LVGKQEVEQFFAEQRFSVRNISSNLFQSLAKHILKNFLPIDQQETLIDLLKLCGHLDLQFRGKGDLDAIFADQYVLSASRS